MPRVATQLMPRKARLQFVEQHIAQLEARLSAAQPIPVFRVARCGHATCGCSPPAPLPADALLIELGCSRAIPQVDLPATEAGFRSRSDTPRTTLPATGSGLGADGVATTLQTLQRLRVLPR
jgi:hypothetical protein